MNIQTAPRSAGVWIDHRQAILMFVSEQKTEIIRISSHTEKQLRRAGTSPVDERFESQAKPADDSRERKYTGQLSRYYDEVTACLDGTQSVLIFGPGEAKGELKKHVSASHTPDHTVALMAAERMTKNQMISVVRRHFALKDATTAAH